MCVKQRRSQNLQYGPIAQPPVPSASLAGLSR
jgi:hypothetical protein